MKSQLLAAVVVLAIGARASAATIVGSNDPGNTPGDFFDVTLGTIVLSDTGVIGNPGSSSDMFGAQTSSNVEGPGHFLFSDGKATNSVTFKTANPVTINGYHLWLAEDGGDTGSRSATGFSLTTSEGTVASTVSIIAPGSTYQDTYGAGLLEITDTFANLTAQTFTATFSSNTSEGGPQVYELDAIYDPEPAGSGVLALGLAVLATRRRS